MFKRNLYLKSLIITVLALGITWFFAAWAAHPETPGERFDRFIAAWTKKCATMKLGRGETTCDILKLKPRDFSQTKLIQVEGQPDPVPQEWLVTAEGQFAHSIKIPNLLPKESGYREGMTSEQYFEHLCEKEAGEFIYKTVANVEGIVQLRPREHATDYMLEHLYALEDPYGTVMEGNSGSGSNYLHSEFSYVGPDGYQFFESKVPPRKPSWPNDTCLRDMDTEFKDIGMPFWRYWGFISWRWDPSSVLGKRICGKPMHAENVITPKSQYGYTWRGISRLHDREMGIAGGELIVLELATNKVLAVRRNYSKSGRVPNNLTGVWWLTAASCPQVSTLVDKKPRKKTNMELLVQVLKPSLAQAQESKEGIK